MISTGLVVVSHSAKIALGVVDLAAQMAPDVPIVAAGGLDGTPEGGIGTSYEVIEAAVEQLSSRVDVAVLTDLGSAVMTAEMVVEMHGGPGRVELVDGPLVEGAIAGAVAAQTGGGLDVVAGAVAAACGGSADAAEEQLPEQAKDTVATDGGAAGVLRREVRIVNKVGLHARPAARVVQLLSGFSAKVTVSGAAGDSVLQLMSLGASQGATVVIESSGEQAREALEALAEMVESGFGEP